MKKIMIIGFSGGGKSTLARRMGKILGIEPTHMDKLHWLPNWVESTAEYKQEKLKPILERERWIIDGVYKEIYLQERLKMADTLIFIDVNRFTCLYHVLKRNRTYKGKTRPDMGEGCEEKIDFEFVKWVLFEGRKKRKSHLQLIEQFKKHGKDTYILKSVKDIEIFLKGLK